MEEEFSIPVSGETKKSLVEIRQEMKAIREEMLATTDPERWTELASELGSMKDELKAANEQVAIFTAGTDFEKATNSVGALKEGLLGLDFGKAQEGATALNNTIKNMQPGAVSASFKALTGVVRTMGSVFVNIGKQLLLNPIFLLAAAIAAIVAIVIVLLDKMGVLRIITDALGKVMKVFTDIIDGVIQALRDMSDWLGWTANAAEDAADRKADAAKKTADAYEESVDRVIQDLDNEIRMAKLNGENTEKLERQKLLVIRERAKLQALAAQEEYRAAKLKGELDEKEMADLRKKATETRNYYKQTIDDIKFFNAEVKKTNKEAAEKQREETAKAEKQRSDDFKKAQEERLKAYQKFLNDEEILKRKRADDEYNSQKKALEREIQSLEENELKKIQEAFKTGKSVLEIEKEVLNERKKLENLEAERTKALSERELNDFKKNQEERIKALKAASIQQKTVSKEELDNLKKQEAEILERIAELEGLTWQEKLVVEADKLIALRNKELARVRAAMKESTVDTKTFEKEILKIKEETAEEEKLIASEKERELGYIREDGLRSRIKIIEAELLEEKKAIQERINKRQRELNALLDLEKENLAKAKGLKKISDEDLLKERKKYLEELMNIELSNTDLTEAEKLLIKQEYAQKEIDLLKKIDEEKKRIEDEEKRRREYFFQLGIENAINTYNSINLLATSSFENEFNLAQESTRKQIEALKTKADAEIELAGNNAALKLQIEEDFQKDKQDILNKGADAEEKIARRQFEINKKLQIAQAIIQGTQATLAAYSSGFAIPVVGPVTGPLFAALAAAASLVQINKIKNSTFGGNGSNLSLSSSSASTSVSTPTSPAPATPSFTLFGTGGQWNNAGTPGKSGEFQSKSGEMAPIMVKAYVSETEITSTQNKVATYKQNAEI